MKRRGLISIKDNPVFIVLVVIIMLASGSAYKLFCQVKIKEKVEIKPQSDTCFQRFPATGYGFFYTKVTVDNAILTEDGYYILYGGNEYTLTIKLCEDYRDPETLEPVHYEFDAPADQLFNANIFVNEDNVDGTAFISGEDTCMCLNGIKQGFRILAGNGSDKDTSYCILNIGTAFNGMGYGSGTGVCIIKSQLITTFEPTTISAGDTIKIFIKRKTADGVIREYSPEQQFEAGMLEGCDYGKFIWPGLKEIVHIKKTVYTNDSVYVIDSLYIKDKDSVYVKDVKQPIIFVAADTFDTETPAVKLRIGVKGNECYEMGALAKSRFKEKRTIESNSCALIDFQYNDFTILDKTITKKDCSNWACNSETKLPKMDVKEINCGNGTDRQKGEIKSICSTNGDWGFFLPLWDGPLIEEPIYVEPCFYKGAWQFNYINSQLWLDAYVVFCPDCIDNGWILENKTDVWRIPEDKLCAALADFNAQRSYGANVTFKIKEATMLHERLHKNDFFTAKSKTLYNYPENSEMKYISLLVNTGWDCDKFRNYDETVEKMQDYWTEKIAEFKSDLESVFEGITHKKNESENKKYEIGLWDRKKEVQKILNDYIDEIKKRIKEVNKNRPENLKIKCK